MTKPFFTPVAQGSYRKGYRGVIFRDYDGPTERIVARCKHPSHPTTAEARSCIASAWFHGHDIDNIQVVDDGP